MRDKNRKRITTIVQRNNRVRRRHEHVKKLVASCRKLGLLDSASPFESPYGVERETRILADPLPPNSQTQLEEQIANGEDLHSIVGNILSGRTTVTGRLKSRLVGVIGNPWTGQRLTDPHQRQLTKNIDFAVALQKRLDKE